VLRWVVPRPVATVGTALEIAGVMPMSEVRFSVQLHRGVPVVSAPEGIDITNASALRSALLVAAAHGNGDGTLVIDMTQTQFCDASGLRTLLAAHERAQADGGRVLLAVTGAAVLRVFQLAGIDGMIPRFATLDEALAQTTASADGSEPPTR
jgi:anti-sigma B factor antagonist